MKKLVTLFIVMVVIALAASPALALIGGVEDTEHTNVGAIVYERDDPEIPLVRLCTATMIHPQVLVTAAHCYSRFERNIGFGDFDKVWVSFDLEPLAEGATFHAIQTIIPHPDYGGTWVALPDVALVILEEPVTDGRVILPEPLPYEGYMEDVIGELNGKEEQGIQMTVVGYGATQLWPQPVAYPDATRWVGTVTYANLLPFEIVSSNERLDNTTFCWGDSGGPMFHVDQDGNEVLVGVLSLNSGGEGCDGDPIQMSFETRLDTAEVLEFINDTIEAYFPSE